VDDKTTLSTTMGSTGGDASSAMDLALAPGGVGMAVTMGNVVDACPCLGSSSAWAGCDPPGYGTYSDHRYT